MSQLFSTPMGSTTLRLWLSCTALPGMLDEGLRPAGLIGTATKGVGGRFL